MQRPIVTIPRGLWRERAHDWHIDWRGQAAGTTLNGQTKVVHNAFPRWKGTPKFLLHGEQFLRWRAILAEGQGHVGIYRVSMFDPLSFRRDPATRSLGEALLTTGKGQEPTPTAVAVGDHPEGSTTIRLDCSPTGAPPGVGHIMSHGADWPFTIRWLDPVAGQEGVYDVRIAPGLREAMPDGQEVRYAAVGRFELANRDQGFPAYTPSRTGEVSIQLQEVLTR